MQKLSQINKGCEELTFLDALNKSVQFLDFKNCEELFRGTWDDFSEDPDLSGYSQIDSAWLNYVCGNFLLNFGSSKSILGFTPRGRKLLTNAVDMFVLLGDSDMACKSLISVGFSYYLERNYAEFETSLYEAESRFPSTESYLLAQVNRLILLCETSRESEGLKIIEEISSFIDLSDNDKLKCQFHNEAGIILRRVGQFDDAISHYEKSLEIALKLNNERFLAQRLNNLAYALCEAGKFNAALDKCNQSLAIYNQLYDRFYIAAGMDTKAQILLGLGHYPDAIQAIQKSIMFFKQDNHHRDYIESTWVKIRIHIQMNQQDTAETFFNHLLVEIADHLGQDQVDRYKVMYSRLINSRKNYFNFDKITPFKYCFNIASRFPDYYSREISFYIVPMSIHKQYPHLCLDVHEDIIMLTESSISDISSTDTLLYKYNSDEYQIGELIINKTINLENCRTGEISDFYSVFHFGKILGYVKLSEVDNDSVSLTEINS
jgi:tetratricopeptide (TPR) repeat protein